MGTYYFRNPHKAKYEAARLKVRPLPASNVELRAKLERSQAALRLAMAYLSIVELRDFNRRMDELKAPYPDGFSLLKESLSPATK